MNTEQRSAARRLTKALESCAKADLAMYVFDSSVYVAPRGVDPLAGPQPGASINPELEYLYVPGLHCDGGAGN